MRHRIVLSVVLVLSVLSCGTDSVETVRIGLMPAVDAIPLVVAEAEGYFAAEGIEVETQLFRDQLLREAALQADEVDVAISDLVNVLQARDNGADYTVVLGTQGHFSLLSSPDSQIRTLDDWPDRPVATGLVETSIVNYLAEKMLAAGSLPSDLIELVPVLQIPVRMEMLLENQLEAVVLPEPLSRIAVARGAQELADTSSLAATPGVVVATQNAIDAKTPELRALIRAYNAGAEAFLDNPGDYDELLAERLGFPQGLSGSIVTPLYHEARPPSEEMVRDVSEWMIRVGMIDGYPVYEDVISRL